MFEAKVYIPYNRWGEVKEKFRVPLEEGYTLIPAMGGWKGVEEHVYILQILRNRGRPTRNIVRDIAIYLHSLGEEAVLLYCFDFSDLVSGWKIEYA